MDSSAPRTPRPRRSVRPPARSRSRATAAGRAPHAACVRRRGRPSRRRGRPTGPGIGCRGMSRRLPADPRSNSPNRTVGNWPMPSRKRARYPAGARTAAGRGRRKIRTAFGRYHRDRIFGIPGFRTIHRRVGRRDVSSGAEPGVHHAAGTRSPGNRNHTVTPEADRHTPAEPPRGLEPLTARLHGRPSPNITDNRCQCWSTAKAEVGVLLPHDQSLINGVVDVAKHPTAKSGPSSMPSPRPSASSSPNSGRGRAAHASASAVADEQTICAPNLSTTDIDRTRPSARRGEPRPRRPSPYHAAASSPSLPAIRSTQRRAAGGGRRAAGVVDRRRRRSWTPPTNAAMSGSITTALGPPHGPVLRSCPACSAVWAAIPAAGVTASRPSPRGPRAFEDIALHRQLGHLTAQSLQLRAFVLGQRALPDPAGPAIPGQQVPSVPSLMPNSRAACASPGRTSAVPAPPRASKRRCLRASRGSPNKISFVLVLDLGLAA